MHQILEKKLEEQKQQAANDTPCPEVTKPDPPKGREAKGKSQSDSSSSIKQEPVMHYRYDDYYFVTLRSLIESETNKLPAKSCTNASSVLDAALFCVIVAIFSLRITDSLPKLTR